MQFNRLLAGLVAALQYLCLAIIAVFALSVTCVALWYAFWTFYDAIHFGR
jgi:hypothetical protein